MLDLILTATNQFRVGNKDTSQKSGISRALERIWNNCSLGIDKEHLKIEARKRDRLLKGEEEPTSNILGL